MLPLLRVGCLPECDKEYLSQNGAWSPKAIEQEYGVIGASPPNRTQREADHVTSESGTIRDEVK